MNEELREWLGIKPADFMVYGALAAIFGMYQSSNAGLDVVLAAVAVFLATASCFVGARPDPRLSRAANLAKRFSYPLCLVSAIVFTILNFLVWDKWPL